MAYERRLFSLLLAWLVGLEQIFALYLFLGSTRDGNNMNEEEACDRAGIESSADITETKS